jgi:hypothetical protein
MICGCVDRVSAKADAANNTTNVNESYPEMPSIPPIGVKISKYLEVPVASLGPTIDPAQGYRVQDLGRGLYIVTDNSYQSMFMVYDRGVVVIDVPPSVAAHIPEAIAKVADKLITHLVYSHSHADHIGGAKALAVYPISSRIRIRFAC